jgi:glucose/arabinose dehydrogenase
MRLRQSLVAALLFAVLPAQAEQLALRPMFGGESFKQPVFMQQSPTRDDLWYVVERGGRIYRVREDGSDRQLVLDISDRVESGPMEAGLLSMAFDPRFSRDGLVYLSYTEAGSPLTSIVARYRSQDGGMSINPHSRKLVLQVKQPYRNHNGGHLAFGPDGYLYYGLGDGGAAGDPKGNGQDPTTLLGAILRLDVERISPYAIPADNPFAKKRGGRGEIYAWGLRNPWRWSFDRQTGDLWVGDVGQNKWEEVDRVRAGDNLGWNRWEGNHCYRQSQCSATGVVMPRAEYSHAMGCSITGGYVYRGKAMPFLQGEYLYGDYCSGRVWALKADNRQAKPQLVLMSGKRIASFSEDRNGELYLLDLASGRIFRLISE